MAMFSLGSGVVVRQKVPYGVTQAFHLAEELINDYKKQGLKVELRESREGERLLAGISNREGTKLQVLVQLDPLDTGCEVAVTLTGKVHVGGMQGMFASDSKVRSIAKERMVALLKKIFDPSKIPVEAVPEPASEDPAPADDLKTEEAREPSAPLETPIVEESGGEDELVAAPETPAVVEMKDDRAPEVVVEPEDPEEKDGSEAPGDDLKVKVDATPSGGAPADKVSAVVANAAGRSLEERLTILKLMLDQGLITNDDFKWKKNELLASI